MKGFLRRHYKKFLVVCVLVLIIWFSVRPSNERGWTLDQMVLPYSIREGNLVHIKNIRNFTYRTTKDYSPGYYEKTFALDKIKSVDFVIEPFIRYWNIKKSEDAKVTFAGVIIGTGYEPKNHTTEAGIKMGLIF